VGTWGVQIFEDDIALDVWDAWVDALADPEGERHPVAFVRELLPGFEQNPEGAPKFRIALAALELDRRGEVDGELRERTFEAINDDLEGWKDAFDPDDYGRRRDVLDALRARLVGDGDRESPLLPPELRPGNETEPGTRRSEGGGGVYVVWDHETDNPVFVGQTCDYVRRAEYLLRLGGRYSPERGDFGFAPVAKEDDPSIRTLLEQRVLDELGRTS
jgi:hypothetical protein